MKITELIIVETDTELTSNTNPTCSKDIARVIIPQVAEPLKLLVKLLQTVDDTGKPKRKYTKREKSSARNGVPA